MFHTTGPDFHENILTSFLTKAKTLAEERNCTASTIYDHIAGIRKVGHDIGTNNEGEYFEIIADGGVQSGSASHTNHTEARRQTSTSKAAITRKANEFLTELEAEVKTHAKAIGPAVADGGLQRTEGGQDVVIHRTDDHFGDVVKDVNGGVEFNSDIAEARVRSVFDNALDMIEMREQMGSDVDTVHVVLGGDHVTNEAIFDGQAWEVDETIKSQLNRATRVYDEEIERLSSLFTSVQVVCIGGNHGEFRVEGSSNSANVHVRGTRKAGHDIVSGDREQSRRVANTDDVELQGKISASKMTICWKVNEYLPQTEARINGCLCLIKSPYLASRSELYFISFFLTYEYLYVCDQFVKEGTASDYYW